MRRAAGRHASTRNESCRFAGRAEAARPTQLQRDLSEARPQSRPHRNDLAGQAHEQTPAVPSHVCRRGAGSPTQGIQQMNSASIVSKVWSFCTTLRNDGVGYGDYLEQLTYLIFLKMADEYARPPYGRDVGIPQRLIAGQVSSPAAARRLKRITLRYFAGLARSKGMRARFSPRRRTRSPIRPSSSG